MANSIAASFWARVVKSPDQPALSVFDGASFTLWTWGQLGSLAEDCLTLFEQHELPPGGHIGNTGRNSAHWVACDIACQTSGRVHVAIDGRLPKQLKSRLLAHSESLLDFAALPNLQQQGSLAPELADKRWQMAQQISAEAPAQILFTSGTSSGTPRGALLSNGNLASNAKAKLSAAPQHDTDIRCNILPFSHAYARTCELSTWIIAGGELVIVSNWEDLPEVTKQRNVTLINCVPLQAQTIASELQDNPSYVGEHMRLLQIGGAAVSVELFQQLSELGLPPIQGYGQTEASPVICSNRAGYQQPGTVGPPVPGVEIRLDAQKILWTRGPHTMLGYWNEPEATAKVLKSGWLCTGDRAETLANGHLRILGRLSSELCLSTGNKVMPEPIESRLLEEPIIGQVVLVGQDMPVLGALIWPEVRHIPSRFFRDGIVSRANLDENRFLQDLQRTVDARLEEFPAYARPSKLCLLAEKMSVASGNATAKGTPNRQSAERLFRQLA